MNDILRDQKTEIICPYIGLFSDAQTAMENPSPQNFCHNLKPVSSPSLAHQSAFCLKDTFTQCQYFSEKAENPGYVESAKINQKNRKWMLLVLVALLGFALLGVIFFARGELSAWLIPPAPQKGSTPVLDLTASTQVPSVEPVQTKTVVDLKPTAPVELAESTLTMENQTQPTSGLTPILIKAEETLQSTQTPVAKGRVFLLHRVSRGEDLLAIAEKYNTSVDAIRTVNYNIAPELWVDTMIVIPVDQTDVTGVTPMIPLEITGSEKSIQELAVEHTISPDLLGEVNSRSITYRFQIGEWVIMPQVIPSPT